MTKYRIKELKMKGGFSKYVIQEKYFWPFGWQDALCYPGSSCRVFYFDLKEAKKKITDLEEEPLIGVKYHY